MKKELVFACAFAVMAACTTSPVKKAESLIKSEKSKAIAKGTTYEVIETAIDSAFSPKDDPKFFKQMEEATQMNYRFNALQEELTAVKDSLSMFSEQPESKAVYENLLERQKNLTWEVDLIKDKGHEKYTNLMAMVDGDSSFIGYKAMHTYKIQNEAGTSLPITEFYLFDKDMKQIVYSCSSIYYEEAQEGIRSLEIANAIKKDREGVSE